MGNRTSRKAQRELREEIAETSSHEREQDSVPDTLYETCCHSSPFIKSVRPLEPVYETCCGPSPVIQSVSSHEHGLTRESFSSEGNRTSRKAQRELRERIAETSSHERKQDLMPMYEPAPFIKPVRPRRSEALSRKSFSSQRLFKQMGSGLYDRERTEARRSTKDVLELKFQTSTNTSVPSITCTKDIGPEGGRITVGDCFIEFQPGTFTKFRKVTVTARIDSSEWPEGDPAITPTLDVNVGKLLKPAKVRLSTWATTEGEMYLVVQILHFCDNTWDLIQTQQLGSNLFIEFQCDSFSKILAKVAGLFRLPISIIFQPTLIIFGNTFVTALHVKDKILSQSISSEFTVEKAKVAPHNPMFLKAGNIVEIELECGIPESGFIFQPPQPFSKPIDRRILMGCILHNSFVLRSELDDQNTIINFKVGIRGGTMETHAIEHYWRSTAKSKGDEISASLIHGTTGNAGMTFGDNARLDIHVGNTMTSNPQPSQSCEQKGSTDKCGCCCVVL